MTLQQQAANVIEQLPDEKILQVIQFARFLSTGSDFKTSTEQRIADEDGYIRKPGILKRNMIMSEDFDEIPECFKEYM
ncbi:MAG: DUF2281 domain-containing protein [Lachnospiraceae bacterium]|jgi:hypothetical protein|nr:DUF2281 domain-containing protein [Lachnospiraceae bacterium]